MPASKKFEKKNWIASYTPDENRLVFTTKERDAIDSMNKDINQLKTFLTVDETQKDFKKPPFTVSLTLSPQSSEQTVVNLLMSNRYEGGETIDDLESLQKKAAEEANRKQRKEMEQQMPAPTPPETPPAGGQPPMAAEGVFKSAYKFLVEAEVFSANVKKKIKQKKRTGKYWNALENVIGKKRNEINKQDVLDLRGLFSKKPFSQERNAVLKSLDKASDYFFKKIKRESGDLEAERYNETYNSIDNLSPKDYPVGSVDYAKSQEVPLDQAARESYSLRKLFADEDQFKDVDYSDIEIEQQ